MSRQSDRAVSPVVAVILMVAVTVILSAVIGTFVLDLGKGLGDGGTQEVGLSTSVQGSNVTFQVVTGEADELRLLINGSVKKTIRNVNPGDSVSYTVNSSDRVSIVAVADGQSTVVLADNPVSDTSGSSSSSIVGPSDGLVAYYEFETGSGTTAYDSANSNDGSLVNGTSWLSGGKVGSYAVSFDGTDDHISISESSSLEIYSKISATFWFYADSKPGSWNTLISGNNDWYVNRDSSNNIQFGVIISGTKYVIEIPSSSYSTGTWHHIAVTYNGSATRIYLDGSEVASNTSVSGQIDDNSQSLTLGGSPGVNYFGGDMDDVRVYNRNLSSQEVQDLYNKTK